MGRNVIEMEVEIKVPRTALLVDVQVKLADLAMRLRRYEASVRETPRRRPGRLKAEVVAIDGVIACVRQADEALAKAQGFADVLVSESPTRGLGDDAGEGGQGTVS